MNYDMIEEPFSASCKSHMELIYEELLGQNQFSPHYNESSFFFSLSNETFISGYCLLLVYSFIFHFFLHLSSTVP